MTMVSVNGKNDIGRSRQSDNTMGMNEQTTMPIERTTANGKDGTMIDRRVRRNGYERGSERE